MVALNVSKFKISLFCVKSEDDLLKNRVGILYFAL
jgi:hypothetical protein